jgi:hypothetical protein
MEFADIALAKFLQSAPELGPLIINFSEVTDEMQDSTSGTRVGIFILKAGSGIVTVPVISKGDTIFPIDSVFIESEAKFRPLSAATINYIIDAASTSPGKVKKIPETVDTNPNLQNLINPPRTGKFTYASTSRLTEFLAVLPNHVKQFAFEKISSEQSVYNTLDKLFGLRAIFSALNGAHGGTGSVNSVATGSPVINSTISMSVITSPREVRDLMNDALSKTFLDQGYVVTGGSDSFRAAIAYQPYNVNGTFSVVNPNTDGGREYEVVLRNGASKRAYVPKYHVLNPDGMAGLISIFEDGNYARGPLITNGQPVEELTVLKTLFDLRPPKLLKELERDEYFMMFTVSGEALGPFNARSVTRTANGVEIKTYAGKVSRICGYQNFTKEIDSVGDSLFVPSNIIVFPLGEDHSNEVELSINGAAEKKENITAQYLGAELDIRHDGVEFSTNGQSVGGFPSAMKALVEGENLDPGMAENFLKQAQVTKFVKLFLSKKASTTDANPTQIPQYGAPAPRVDETNLSGSFMPAVQSATDLGDSQAMESTIIAQLLQVPELFEYIQEYLPELEETTDKLGRILFLTRAKLDQISEALDSDSVFSMIAQIKTVYRQLGDTCLKLKAITESSIGFDKDKVVGQTNGQ